MIEKISEYQRNVLDNYVLNWGGRAINRGLAPLEKRLQFWERDKATLFRMMGGELILEKEVEYDRDIDDLSNELYDAMGQEGVNFYERMRDYFYRKAATDFPDSDVKGQWKYIWMTGVVNTILSYEHLCENAWPQSRGNVKIPLPDGKFLGVNPGTKMTRILGKLAKAYGIDGWEDVREAHAKISTFKRTTGTLCLSIHPLDFYTLSDNDEGWNSCMNWTCEDDDDDYGGSYRAGTVEMMNSPCIVVAYLKNDKHEFEGWNSKVWRELMIVDKNVITNIKGYPATNDFLTQEAIKWLRELAEKNLGWTYVDEMMTYNTRFDYNGYGLVDSKYFEEHAIDLRFECDHMYNDTRRQHAFAFVNPSLAGFYEINYSGVMNCQVCGNSEDVVSFESDNRVACQDCNPIYFSTCDICGRTIYDEDDCYEVDGETLCVSCWDNEVCYPDNDPDEPHLVRNCTELVLINVPEHISGRSIDGEYRVNLVDYYYTVTDYVTDRDKVTTWHGYHAIDFAYATRQFFEDCAFMADFDEFDVIAERNAAREQLEATLKSPLEEKLAAMYDGSGQLSGTIELQPKDEATYKEFLAELRKASTQAILAYDQAQRSVIPSLNADCSGYVEVRQDALDHLIDVKKVMDILKPA